MAAITCPWTCVWKYDDVCTNEKVTERYEADTHVKDCLCYEFDQEKW